MFFRFLHHTLLIIIIGCFSSHSAEEGFNPESLKLTDKLKDIASEIFSRDRNKPYTKIEICTHSPNVVEEWKNYVKPSTNGVNTNDWRSALQRQSIYVFNELNNETILSNIEELMRNRENFDVLLKQMGGDASKTRIVEVLVHRENSGIRYGDQDVPLNKPFSRRKKSTQEYTAVPVNNIKIFIDISSIVREIEEKGHIDGIQNLGSIKTICPAD